jgi:hypothetical protein
MNKKRYKKKKKKKKEKKIPKLPVDNQKIRYLVGGTKIKISYKLREFHEINNYEEKIIIVVIF